MIYTIPLKQFKKSAFLLLRDKELVDAISIYKPEGGKLSIPIEGEVYLIRETDEIYHITRISSKGMKYCGKFSPDGIKEFVEELEVSRRRDLELSLSKKKKHRISEIVYENPTAIKVKKVTIKLLEDVQNVLKGLGHNTKT
jgi:hypothetical protein